MADELDILIKFLVDTAAKKGTAAAIDELIKQIDSFEKSIEGAKRSARELKNVSKEVAQASREAFLIGTAITGGIFAAANQYVKNAKEATAVTIAWKAAQDQLNESGTRIGAILAEEALPLLERAAVIADKVAGFVEQHPEIVSAALNTGLVVASLGAVGIAVSKGIRLYADVAYLVAVAKEAQGFAMFDAAVNKFLGGVSTFGKNAPGASLLSPGPLLGIGAGAALFAGIGTKASQFGASLFGTTPEKFWKDLAVNLGLVEDASAAASNKLEDTAANLRSVANSPQFDQILKAYDQYRREDMQATTQHLADKKRVEDSARAATQKANEQYAAAVNRINQQTTAALVAAANQFDQANQQAEIQYAEQRAQIIRDSGEEIKQIESDLQEELRKSAIEHSERMQDLTAARDALGLEKENQRHAQDNAEKIRAANLEIRQRRADVAQRLEDLATSYEQERGQRFAEYEARRNEIQAQAAAELSQLAEQHRAEIQEIQRNKVERIREIDSQFAEERKRRVQQFLQTVRDLDASLLGEQNLKQRYYAAMAADLDRFLAGYQAKLSSLAAAAPGSSAGGYSSGLVRTGEQGIEFVMSNRTTRAAENIIGGRLTQDSLIAALMNSGAGKGSLVWNDQRRFDGQYTNEIRRAVRDDTLSMLEEALS